MNSKLCELCGGSAWVIQRPARVIGATYPEDDPWKGDEHIVPCPLCSQSPWDMARGTGKVIITRILGPIYGVYYPHRKSGDCYVVGPDGKIKCCQPGCDALFPVAELGSHIEIHDTRKRKKVSGRSNQ